MQRLLLIIILFGSAASAIAQKQLCILSSEQTSCFQSQDTFSQQLILQQWVKSKQDQGFLACGIDSVVTSADTVKAYGYIGNKYQYLKLRRHNLPAEFWTKTVADVVPIKLFENQTSKLLKVLEENGYPFANIQFDSIEVKGDTLSASLFYDPSYLIKYDTFFLVGRSKLSANYLYRYLNIHPGNLYAESAIKAIDKKLRNLPLVRLKSPTRVYFYRGLARLVIDLDDRITDRFDGIVGIAPNSENGEENSLLVTGEVNIELNNLLQSGKQVALHWRNYLKRSQLLDVEFTWPYLFNTKLGLNGKFDLNKYDTLFVNLNSKIGFRYQQKGNNYLQFYYQYTGSNLLTVDTNQIRQSKRIPTNNPFRIDNYGIAVHQSEFDYLPNPRRGYLIHADAAIGLKELLRNTEVDAVKFVSENGQSVISIYDTLEKKSLRARFELEFKGFIPIFKSSTLLNHIRFGGVFSEQIQRNEFYNIGGFSTLRGFDENELFVSKFITYNLEYRYLISENSSVGLFVNAAATENEIDYKKGLADIPYGFGAVANLEVRNGILSLAYALGSQQGNPIIFRSAKFHFGIVNYF